MDLMLILENLLTDLGLPNILFRNSENLLSSILIRRSNHAPRVYRRSNHAADWQYRV